MLADPAGGLARVLEPAEFRGSTFSCHLFAPTIAEQGLGLLGVN
jgi:hypothetical protein